MKSIIFACLLVLSCTSLAAQGPRGKEFGFGFILGEPTGATIKYWLNKENAIDAAVGGSGYGAIRIHADYLWHFSAFNSDVVKLYIGPGLGVGIGNGGWGLFYHKGKNYWYERTDGGTAVFGRMAFGANIIPRRSPIEIFVELAPVIGFSPVVGVGVEAALGLRFYP